MPPYTLCRNCIRPLQFSHNSLYLAPMSSRATRTCRETGLPADNSRKRSLSMDKKSLTRRTLLRSAAIGSTTLAVATFGKPFIHSAFSAGTLDVGLWDHWVPGGNDAWKKLAKEWGDKNH